MVAFEIITIIICSIALVMNILNKQWKWAILMVACIIFDVVITLINC